MQTQIIKRICILGIVAISATWSTYHFPLPVHLTKKINKTLIRIFGKDIQRSDEILIDSHNGNHHVFNLTQRDSLMGYAIASRALGCKIGGCSTDNKEGSSFEEFFYMTVFNTNCQIEKVKVIEYTSDHGYQIANRGWLKQFIHKENFTVGENIDAISGATISVNSIVNGINTQKDIIRKLQKNDNL
jgi:hypothetical protein